MKKSDRDLGMDREITRRDFLNGASVAVGGAGAIGARMGSLRRGHTAMLAPVMTSTIQIGAMMKPRG